MAVESQQSLKKKTPRVVYDKQMYILVGGFNPSKKISVKFNHFPR